MSEVLVATGGEDARMRTDFGSPVFDFRTAWSRPGLAAASDLVQSNLLQRLGAVGFRRLTPSSLELCSDAQT